MTTLESLIIDKLPAESGRLPTHCEYIEPSNARSATSATPQDSADWYHNEEGCGRAIREFINDNGLQRSDIFYTSKLKSNSGKTNAAKAINKSLKECGLGYIDLYLIHSPLGGPQMRRESWEAIAEAQKEGKLKSIGISNFGVRHMEELLGKGLPDPAVNQVRLSLMNGLVYLTCETRRSISIRL